MTFEVIAGSGHCGTMWLSQVLNSAPGQNWFHEKRTHISGMPWWVADLHRPGDREFDHYWTYARQWIDGGHFGDSNSWPPESLPAVNRIQPIDRVIYLTRDKDAQLYSLTTKSPLWSNGRYTAAAQERLDVYAQISGLLRTLNLLVEANDFMPVYLQQQGLTVEVYSLEELTTSLPALRKLAPLTDVELQAWQLRKINSKKHTELQV